jgi:hypothetical protein
MKQLHLRDTFKLMHWREPQETQRKTVLESHMFLKQRDGKIKKKKSGGGLSLGRGFPIVSLTKQQLNTRSSTETEIVGADDFMPAISAILVEKNGKASSSKQTKHITSALFRKFRNLIMGMTTTRDPGPGKPNTGNGEFKTQKANPSKGNKSITSLVPPGKGRHHRSVLGEVTERERTKDSHSKRD